MRAKMNSTPLFVFLLTLGLGDAHHSWFSRTWRKITGASSDQDQCLVACQSSGNEAGPVCGLMWASLTEVLVGRPDNVPDFLANRRFRRDILDAAAERETKRKVCCFLTEFPQAKERCCSLLKHFCNSLPYDKEVEDTRSGVDKLGSSLRGMADKLGINLGTIGLDEGANGSSANDDLVFNED